MTNKPEQIDTDQPMSVSQHLKELRKRVVVIVLVFAIAFAVSMTQAQKITDLLMAMGKDNGYAFVFIAPQELIMVYFQIAAICALVITIPVIAYELYKFSIPALSKNEKRAFRNALFFGLGMFVIGDVFAYQVSLPFMLYFLIHLKVGIDIAASISIQSFVSFILTIFLIFGVIFEMPVISALLTRLHLLKPEYLEKGRKIAVVAIFFVAAIITPPDILSQTMVALPMIGLYQMSIWISRLISKRKQVSVSETV